MIPIADLKPSDRGAWVIYDKPTGREAVQIRCWHKTTIEIAINNQGLKSNDLDRGDFVMVDPAHLTFINRPAVHRELQSALGDASAAFELILKMIQQSDACDMETVCFQSIDRIKMILEKHA